ncbi:PaaX family transcriptional regulator [Microbacterium sp. NPDC055683]
MPMKPRALILDLFGDYLRYAPEVRAGALGLLLAEFGVEPATARVTLSRLRQEGWFSTRRSGRETYYRATPMLLDILDEGRSRIFAPYPTGWDGTWTTVVFQLADSDRAAREGMRKTLSWLGFAPLAGTTWISPRGSSGVGEELRRDLPGVQVDVFVSRTDDPAADRELLRRCWDLDALAAVYRAFLDEHRDTARSAGAMAGPDALRARIELTARYRRFPLQDPGIPSVLRPVDWPGADAHALFHSTHDALEAAATEFVETVVGVRIGAQFTSANM